jgi:tRNA threonylcarbamoyladenosine biosynthesis protein TsaB
MTAQPHLLLIETSGAIGRVGLGIGLRLAAQAQLQSERRHASDLAPRCRELLQQSGLRAGDLNGIAVSWGPGSYTGLRVGLMTGKTLAYALKIPLVTVPTFAVLARQARPFVTSDEPFDVIADAQQDRLYRQRWAVDATGRPVEHGPLELVEGKDWRAALGSTRVTGPGVRSQGELLGTGYHALPEPVREPQLDDLLVLASERYESKQFADVPSVEPLYLRPSAAEEKWTALGR